MQLFFQPPAQRIQEIGNHYSVDEGLENPDRFAEKTCKNRCPEKEKYHHADNGSRHCYGDEKIFSILRLHFAFPPASDPYLRPALSLL